MRHKFHTHLESELSPKVARLFLSPIGANPKIYGRWWQRIAKVESNRGALWLITCSDLYIGIWVSSIQQFYGSLPPFPSLASNFCR